MGAGICTNCGRKDIRLGKNSKGNLPTGEQLLKRKAYRDFFSYVSPSANEK